MRPRLIGLLVLAALTGIGCSDDDSMVTPPDFQVTIRVTDPQGFPVEGLDLALVSDTPFYQDGLKTPDYRPAVIIPFQLEQASLIRLTIEDIEGTEVRMLGQQPAEAGVHQWMWNGHDDPGERLPSGVYTAHLVATHAASGDTVLDSRADMLMSIMDPARMSVGTTDADGRIVLSDKRLFPQLFDPADIPAVNEIAEPIGNIRLTPLMRFNLADLTNGGGMRFDREVTGSVTLNFVWDAAKAAQVQIEGKFVSSVPVDPGLNQLGHPYPCPFN